MGRLGRDPEFFRYVEGSVAERILGRSRYALTVLPTHDNPYLEYILTGNFSRALPLYLRPEVFPEVKRNIDQLTLFEGPIDEAAQAHRGDGFDGFNLSDIFEYLDEPDEHAAVYGRLLDAARPGARFAYWNMLVPRRLAESFPERVRSLEAEARELFARDLAFFYSAFVLEEVVLIPPGRPAGRADPLRHLRLLLSSSRSSGAAWATRSRSTRASWSTSAAASPACSSPSW